MESIQSSRSEATYKQDVIFDDSNFNVAHASPPPPAQSPVVLLPGSVQPEEANGGSAGMADSDFGLHTPVSTPMQGNPLYSDDVSPADSAHGLWPTPPPGYAPSKYGYHDPENDAFLHSQQPPMDRPRPSYKGMHVTESAKVFLTKVT